MNRIVAIALAVALAVFSSALAGAEIVKYATGFDEQGSWIDDAYIYVDEGNSRLYWNTDAGLRATYDNISLVTQVGDVVEFEFKYITHSDGNTRQGVRFGFTDELTNTPSTYPLDFIGGESTNYYSQAQTMVEVIRNRTRLFNWHLYHARGVPRTFVGRISILSESEFRVQVWDEGTSVTDQIVPGDATGLPMTMAAAWNRHVGAHPMQGTYTGQVNYLSWTRTPYEVEIDIKPGSDPNSVACNGQLGTLIPVAILTTDSFDATTVDHETVTFEGAMEAHQNPHGMIRHEDDVDEDGDIDLIFHIIFGETRLTEADCPSVEPLEAVLTGETFDGQAIEGSDTVRLVLAFRGCGLGSELLLLMPPLMWLYRRCRHAKV